MRRFSLSNPDFEVPSVYWLEHEWSGAAHQSLARQIGFQVQFAEFFKHLLHNLQSVPTANPDWTPRALSLSVRAGAVRTYALLAVSIAEAALAALGEERELGRRAGELYGQPFGALLKVWAPANIPRQEIQAIWRELEMLKDIRNYVHLPRAADADEATWQSILDREPDILAAVDAVISHLRDMCHVFRD